MRSVSVERAPAGRDRRPLAESLEPRTLLAAGALDPTFDGDGILFPDLNGAFSVPGASRARAVAFGGGGKVVVAGFAGATATDVNRVPAVARLNPDGSLDTTFSGDGWAALPATFENAGGEATAVAVQPDQKVLVGGTTPGHRFGLARFNADGSIDTTFAGDGI